MNSAQPRCAGQNCYKRDGCKRHLSGNGWVDQYKPFRCKQFVPLLKITKKQKLLSLMVA